MSLIKQKFWDGIDTSIHQDFIPMINDSEKEETNFLVFGNYKYYWESTSYIYDNESTLTKDMTDIKICFFHVTEGMFGHGEAYTCIENFFANNRTPKLLQVVNTYHHNEVLFDMPEWNSLVEKINSTEVKGELTIEVVNKAYFSKEEESAERGIEECKAITNCNRVDYFYLEEETEDDSIYEHNFIK